MRRGRIVGIRVVRVAAMVAVLVVSGAVASFGQRAPNPTMTPGAVDAKASEQALCVRGHTVRARRLSARTRRRVFEAYHVARKARDGYTIDRLVPVELGGTNAVANLWPVTLRDARAKRVVVAKVVARMCAGGVDLATAQRAFVADWRAAFETATTTTTSTTTTTIAPPAPATTVEVPEAAPETAPPTVAQDVPQHSPISAPPTVPLPDYGPIGPTTPPQPVQDPVHP